MRRGTTPTIIFHLPFNVNVLQGCEIYFAQNDELLVEKSTSDCILAGMTLATTLTQAETLRFDSEESAKIEIQIRFVFIDGSVDATTIIKEKAEKILKDTEIDIADGEGGGLAPSAIYAAIEQWMEDNPQGGVQDGALTEAKLTPALKSMVRNTYNFANVAFLHEDPENCRYPQDGFSLCCVMWDEDTCIVNDFGSSADGSTLPTFLHSKGISKVDAVIISHYHNDHAIGSSLDGFLAGNLDLSNCTFYLPHGNIDWGQFIGDSGTAPHENMTYMKTKLEAREIPYIEPAEEGYHVDIGQFSVDFYNVDADRYFDDYYPYIYYAKSAERAGSTSYNCFSMCADVSIGGTSIFLSGDIELPAQENMADRVSKADVFLVPHHGRNMRESQALCNNLNCRIGVLATFYDVDGGSTEGILSPTAQRCRQIGTLASTHNRTVSLVIAGGRIYAEGNDSQNGLGLGNIVQQYSDFNDLGHGDWFCRGQASDIMSYSHSPTTVFGYNCSFTMHCEPLNLNATGTDNLVQTAFLRTASGTSPCIVQRVKTSGSWSDWLPLNIPITKTTPADGSYSFDYATLNPASVRGYLPSGEISNLNNAYITGTYMTAASASNLPSGVTAEGFLIVIGYAQRCVQYWSPYNADSIRMRRCVGNPSTSSSWTAWKTITPA